MPYKNSDEILEVRVDKYFHDIFSPLNPNLVKWLVSSILEIPLSMIKEEIVFKNIRLPNLFLSEKVKYCDLIYTIGNTEIIVEVNNNFIGSFIRNDIYAFSNIIGHYSVHEELTNKQKKEKDTRKLKNIKPYYQKDIETILVNINFHKYERDKLRPKREVTELKRNYNGREKILKIVDINIDYYVDKCYNEIGKYEKLYKLFTIKSKKELLGIKDRNTYLGEYQKRILDLQDNRREYLEMVLFNKDIEKNIRREEAYIMGQNDGLELGIEQKTKEMILNMYKNKISNILIAKCTNVAISEVEKIIKSSSKNNKLSINN